MRNGTLAIGFGIAVTALFVSSNVSESVDGTALMTEYAEQTDGVDLPPSVTMTENGPVLTSSLDDIVIAEDRSDTSD